MFAVVLFSRARITRDTASLFRTVGLNVRLGMLPLLELPAFSGAAPLPPATHSELVRLRAERPVLYQLLDAQERTALAEATRAAAARDQLAEQAERSTALARTLQESLLPSDLPAIVGGSAAALFRPAGDGSEVGGDFYDLFPIRRGQWGVVMGDVSGKGAGAAALTALARHTVRSSALREADPVDVLTELNEAVIRNHGETDRYLTAAYAVLRRLRDRAEISLALAGHPQALVLRADGAVHAHGDPGTPLGMFADISLRRSDFTLGVGDTIVLHTDGVTDARNEQDGFFGLDRFASLLASLQGAPVSEIVSGVDAVLEDYQGGRAADDTALLAIQLTR
jgi:sigma-B regulation protein RsbU (phosphoserine phosphatase)